MDSPIEYLGIIATVQAGFYAIKTMGYFWLKNRVLSQPNQERANSILSLWKRGSLLPTPIDLAYIIGRVMKINQNNHSKRASLETEAEPLQEFLLPYSKFPRVIELVEEDTPKHEKPYSRKRLIKLVD